jgi:hypothetical protein
MLFSQPTKDIKPKLKLYSRFSQRAKSWYLLSRKQSIQAAIQLKRRAVLLMGGNKLSDNLPKDIIATNYAPYSNKKQLEKVAII